MRVREEGKEVEDEMRVPRDRHREKLGAVGREAGKANKWEEGNSGVGNLKGEEKGKTMKKKIFFKNRLLGFGIKIFLKYLNELK